MRSNLKGLNEPYFAPAVPLRTVKGLIRSIYGYDFDGNVKQDGLSASLKYDFAPNELDSYYALTRSKSVV